jgi:hypothetical protein
MRGVTSSPSLVLVACAILAVAHTCPGTARAGEPGAVTLAEVESGTWTLRFEGARGATDVPLLGLGLLEAPALADDAAGRRLLSWRTADGAHQADPAAVTSDQASFGGYRVPLEGGPCPLGVVLLPWGQALVVDGDAARTSPADVLVRREEWEATLPAELGGARVELVSLSTPLSGVVLRWLDGARETSGSCTFERERLRTCRLFGQDALVVDLRLDEASDVAGVATATATRGELALPVAFRRR